MGTNEGKIRLHGEGVLGGGRLEEPLSSLKEASSLLGRSPVLARAGRWPEGWKGTCGEGQWRVVGEVSLDCFKGGPPDAGGVALEGCGRGRGSGLGVGG